VSSDGAGSGGDGRSPARGTSQQGIAAAITAVSERASVLVREEIELAKTEITEKATRLAKGAVVAIVAGVFFLTALFFVLIGCAWLLYYELPIGNEFTYFWGFFAMALILVVLGVIAGLLAYKAVKSGAPPTPDMAIEEARKIRETVSSSSDPSASPAQAPVVPVPPPGAVSNAPVSPVSVPLSRGKASDVPISPVSVPPSGGRASDSELGRGTVDGTTHGS
jgi:hypothetical protein